MYESFFGLRERPFAAAPRADRYFPAGSIESARRVIERCVDRAEGIAMLIGPPGSGKSLVSHLLAKRFQSSLSVVHLQNGRFRNCKALLQTILFELRLPYREMETGELRLAVLDFLRTADRCPNGLLLVVDEAHSLTLPQLEELHMISLPVGNGQPRLRLALIGSPGLEEKLTHPRLDSFSQRIVARCYLEALTLEETQSYVRAQSAAVGGPQGLFPVEALTSLHQATDGIPRLINQVCDHALVLAFAGGKRKLDTRVVEEAWADLQQLPSPWADGRRATEGDPTLPAPTIIEFGRLDASDGSPEEEAEEAVERPAIHAWYGDLEQDEPAETLSTLEHHLQELQQDYHSAAASTSSMANDAVTHDDPFAERFAEEEVVIDRFASLDELGFRPEQMVTSVMSGELSRMLEPYDRGTPPRELNVVGSAQSKCDAPNVRDEAAAVAVASPAATDPVLPDEPELIVIEDNPEEVVSSVHPIVKRQEYRQLFAKLRRG